MQPVGPKDRILEIDVLRGFAVLGMVLWDFRSRSMGNFRDVGSIDHAVYHVIAILDIQNTVHLVFAFLFGWGLAEQIGSSRGKSSFLPVHLRRMLVLLGIGLTNCLFLDRTDILYIFAILGVVFPVFVFRSGRMILVSAILLVGAPVLGDIIFPRIIPPGFYQVGGLYDSLKAPMPMFSKYSDLVLMHVRELSRERAHLYAYVHDLDGLGMFLFGLYATRLRVFRDVSAHNGPIRKVLWSSLAVRLIGLGWVLCLQQLQIIHKGISDWFPTFYYLLSLHNRPEMVGMLLKLYSSAAFSIFYLCLIVRMLQDSTLRAVLTPLANVGKLALSIYLLHCLIGTTLFFGYGFALYGKLGLALGEAVAVLVCGFMILISNWWLSTFQFGPIEWLGRSVTYWKPQQLRIPVPRAATG